MELAVDSDVDNTRSVWPAVARVGALHTMKGFDIDIGDRTRPNHAAASEVLVGFIARWQP